MSVIVAARDEIHVWQHSLADTAGADDTAARAACLSPAEEARVRRYRLERDRRRYRRSQCARRAILAMYLSCEPHALAFGHAHLGKPFVRAGPLAHPLTFSASRSDDLGVLAVGWGRAVGVDVERIRPRDFWEPIARSVLSGQEAAALFTLPPPASSRAFMSTWTRREALLKGLGWGLAFGLDPAAAASVRSSDDGGLAHVPVDGRSWCVSSLSTQPGYAAALACEGAVRILRVFHYFGEGVWLEHAAPTTADGAQPASSGCPWHARVSAGASEPPEG